MHCCISSEIWTNKVMLLSSHLKQFQWFPLMKGENRQVLDFYAYIYFSNQYCPHSSELWRSQVTIIHLFTN